MVQTEPVHVDLAGVDDACLRPDVFAPRHGFITSAGENRHEETLGGISRREYGREMEGSSVYSN